VFVAGLLHDRLDGGGLACARQAADEQRLFGSLLLVAVVQLLPQLGLLGFPSHDFIRDRTRLDPALYLVQLHRNLKHFLDDALHL